MDTKENSIILIATTMEIDDDIIQDVFALGAEIVVIPDGYRAVELLEQRYDEVAAVLLDAAAFGMEALSEINERGWVDDIPVIMMLEEEFGEVMDRAYEMGALDSVSYALGKNGIKNRIVNVLRFFHRQKNAMNLAIEQNIKLSEEKYRMLKQDSLTGCLNFTGFKEEAAALLRQNPQIPYEIWYCDIKQFKLINDAFGYESGDRVLKWWFHAVAECLDEKEAIGRVSEDKMVILAYEKNEGKVGEHFRKVDEELDDFLQEIGISYEVEIAAGIYKTKPEERTQPDVNHMVDMANVAQKNVKGQKGRSLSVYSEELWEKQQRTAQINRELKGAIERREIAIWLQPQYNYATGELVGAEVLCRWIHPELGFISPGEFIPVLEKAGQIPILDRFVWEEACRHIKKWMEEDSGIHIALSVNVSRMDIREAGFLQHMQGLLDKYDLLPEMLRLEITESAYIDEPEQLIEVVKKLRNMGFTVEMDDFGSGYSSLNMLKEVPVDVVKLDMKFLSQGGNRSKGGNILSSVVRLSHNLELPVIAEGVETAEQANFLKNLGCNLMQGYWFAKPLPVLEFEKLLRSQMIGELPAGFTETEIRDLDEIMDAESNSSFIFDSCIGGAMLLECAGDFVDAVMVNDAFYETTGITREGFGRYRKNLLLHMSEEEREQFRGAIKAAVADGVSVNDNYTLKNGRVLRTRYRCISSGVHGDIIFVLLEDVTANHELQEKLDRVTEDYYSQMELMPGGFFRYNADGEQNFTFVSNNMLEMLGYTLDGFLEKFNGCFPDMVYEEDRERIMKELDAEITGGVDTYCEYRIERADGTLKWVYNVGRLIVDEDGKRWYYVVITDIDAHRELLRKQLWH